jgi:hypothetical protein
VAEDMAISRVVVVLGMHRSGTSLLTRGLRSLGVYLGEDFVDVQFDNPTGYWEDRRIQNLNERVLGLYGIKWESATLLQDSQFEISEIEAMRSEAIEHIRLNFLAHPLWGFKDPRTLRLFPFWSPVFQRLELDDVYVVAIRNPLSVAESLIARQPDVFDARLSHRLWLAHMVPYLSKIAHKPFVVIDYDLLMADARGQLERIGRGLEIPVTERSSNEIKDFAANFIDPTLRHSKFSRRDRDFIPDISVLVQKAYICLSRLATDKIGPDRSQFWSEWQQIEDSTRRILAD